ncbi:hypothetical protein OIU77_010407 [Salix suchowensis]|uniref:Uncharacterized protein n=1 Tax=Salix suchowensis TaxID=1278906 RepID=A0ABQ9A8P8_9ROSI|nr:hypothetical protein OIU77_010407 [Salix suchowensis]
MKTSGQTHLSPTLPPPASKGLIQLQVSETCSKAAGSWMRSITKEEVLSKAPQLYSKPLLINESMRKLPGNRKVQRSWKDQNRIGFQCRNWDFCSMNEREFSFPKVSATINLGTPSNEMIALRGLVPLDYKSTASIL